jgi:hypothetical protein
MRMISLDEPHLRFQALSILLARLEQDDLFAARDAQLVGLDEPLFQRLRSLPAAELARLSAIKHLKVSIVVDGGSLDYALRTLERLNRERRLLERCVDQQAPRALLTELFGPQAVAFASLYRMRLGEPSFRGRPSLPDPDIRDRIHASWHALEHRFPHLAERYLALAEDYPGLSLASLHAVVNEFAD